MFNLFITRQDKRILNNLQEAKQNLENCIDKVDKINNELNKINNKLDEIIAHREDIRK